MESAFTISPLKASAKCIPKLDFPVPVHPITNTTLAADAAAVLEAMHQSVGEIK
eukprot:m.8349 g.8349  ORF g.8349 m.8349 type:complete len:54 (-) comp3873_c0_seq1:190-351(-)